MEVVNAGDFEEPWEQQLLDEAKEGIKDRNRTVRNSSIEKWQRDIIECFDTLDEKSIIESVKQTIEIRNAHTVFACQMKESLPAFIVRKKRTKKEYTQLCNYYQMTERELLYEKNISNERLNYLKSMKLLLKVSVEIYEEIVNSLF